MPANEAAPEGGLLHLVLPAYREQGRIAPFLEELAELAPAMAPCQILVVEDGSPAPEQEATLETIRPIVEASDPVLPPLVLPDNLGKGGAVRAGFDAAPDEATWLGFVDADGAVPAREVLRMVSLARDGGSPDTAYLGTRVKMLGRQIDRKAHRHVLGRIFATLSSAILKIPAYDTQCGLKLIPAAAYRTMASKLRITGFAFDLEMIALLLDSGTKVEEVPIDWSEKEGSTVNLLSHPPRMLRAIFDINRRRRHNR